MCEECTPVYVRSVLGDGSSAYPAKCPECQGGYMESDFEMFCTSKQISLLDDIRLGLIAVAAVAHSNTDIAIRCTKCPYLDVRSVKSSCIFMCRHPHCRAAFCIVCNADVHISHSEDGVVDAELAEHSECSKYTEVCRELALVGTRRCPSCHASVVKDDACTQMLCSCGHKWCYVCENDLGRDADIHGQTSDRIESPNCPMYLEAFHEWDPT